MIKALFPDLLNALGKAGVWLKAAIDIPKKERIKYREAMKETYRLLDATLNIVIFRLGDILLLENDSEFMQEVARLDNYDEWRNAEREIRLCESLRVVYREAETLGSRVVGSRSVADWDALLAQMDGVFALEHEVAVHINAQFQLLAQAAWKDKPPKTMRKQVKALRKNLVQEREKLIKQEIAVYSIII